LPKPEAPSRRPLLENIPDSTVAPILMPTFAPKQIEPAASSDPEPVPTHAPADSTMRPTPEPTAAPEASVVEPAASETRSEAPEPQAPSESTPEAANGGCGPPSVQGGFVGEIALLLVLGTPFGLVLGRRWGIWKL